MAREHSVGRCELGAQIRADDGAVNAVSVLEEVLAHTPKQVFGSPDRYPARPSA